MTSPNRFMLRTIALLAAVLAVTLTLAAATTQTDLSAAAVLAAEMAGPDAPAPLVLNYQGRLSDLAGNPKPDGTYSMTFALYGVDSGGSPLWTETRDVSVKGGLFSVRLGEVTALPAIFDGRALWLGVTVGGDPQATPRLPVAFVAYALYANSAGAAANADRLGGQPPSSYAAAGHTHDAGAITTGSLAYDRFNAYGDLVNDGKIGAAADMVAAGLHTHTGADIVDGSIKAVDLADDSVTSAKIADGGVALADLAANSVDSARIVDLAVATADLANSSVTTAKIADGAVTAAKLASGVVPKFFTLNTFGAFLEGGATFATGWGPYAGMRLPDSGTPNFSFSFVIPPDYTPGTNLTVRFIWHTPATSCGIVLAPNYISVARAGRTHIAGSGVSDGLTMVGGNVLSAPATANQSSAKDMTISTPVPGTNLQAGDSIIFGVYRSSGSASDTCANYLVIQGVSVSYQ